MTKRRILIISECCRDCVSALHGFINIKEQVFQRSISGCNDIQFDLFDIILLDCGYNVPLGISLIEKIKKAAPQSIVLFIANNTSEDHLIKIFRLGARDFIKKPIDIHELRSTLSKLYNAKISSHEKRSPVFTSLQNKGLTVIDKAITNNSCNMEKVINYIDENLEGDINLEDLEQIANLSKYHFIRRFKNHTGFTPKEYIIYSRIEKAIKILKTQNDINISRLSSDIGFNYVSSFTKHFTKYTGCTPLKYKKIRTDQGNN